MPILSLLRNALGAALLLGATLAFAQQRDPDLAGGEARLPAIRVAAGDWGRADAQDIEAVLRSAAEALWNDGSDRAAPAIVVVPVEGYPRVFYEKTAAGEYVIGLSARDRRWSQYAYQFAHELCHVLANFNERRSDGGAPLSRHQWFEETLCEAASLFTLRRMGRTWAASPPFPQWKSYARSLDEYAEAMLAAEHRRGAEPARLAEWYAANAAALASDPYARERNEFPAAALLPLFEAQPRQWAALRFLNRDGSAAASTFRGYLRNWHRSVPETHAAFIDAIVAAFGVAGPVALR